MKARIWQKLIRLTRNHKGGNYKLCHSKHEKIVLNMNAVYRKTRLQRKALNSIYFKTSMSDAVSFKQNSISKPKHGKQKTHMVNLIIIS